MANKGKDVSIYDRDIDVVNDINSGKNDKYIKGLKIPKNVIAYNDQDEALKGCEYLVLAVPSHIIRTVSNSLKGRIPESIPVICIAKGIEEGTNKTLAEVIEEELPNPVVILSGPSHAEEVAFGIPTTVLTTSHDMKYAEEVQDLFMTKEFRVYTNDDIIGVEIGGAVKNVIALASGVCDGIGYGDNTKAALMTRGMAEIVRLSIKLGANPSTLYGLSGMGDLIATCSSPMSRNYTVGSMLGKGKKIDDILAELGSVAEGVKTSKAVCYLAKKLELEVPISSAIYEAVYTDITPQEILSKLMNRKLKKEENYDKICG